ncbi:hypothetical protein IWZ01DRAFT_537632 [Phyllosticta capitalensis]
MSLKRKRKPSSKALEPYVYGDDSEDDSLTEISPIQTQPTQIIIPDGDWLEEPVIADEFSDILKSRTVKVVVGHQHSSFVHEGLLCRASDKFQKQLKGQFREAHTGEIEDCDEDPTHFFVFLKYLYKGKAVLKEKSPLKSQFIVWANLYCMADRLEAKKFQEAIFAAFSDTLVGAHPPSNDEICDVLLLLHNGLPERVGYEYPLRNLVFWYAATKLASLKQHLILSTTLLTEHPVLATKILMYASPTQDRKPSFTSESPEAYWRKKKDLPKKDLAKKYSFGDGPSKVVSNVVNEI